jgi:dihydroorotate dehydrogenase electron transfer subunit
MKKLILDLILKKNIRLNEQVHLLIFSSEQSLPKILPGQFVQVKIDDSPATFLRRPFSVNFVDDENNELWLLIQIVGAGTLKLSETFPGVSVNMILPLGNSFTFPDKKDEKILLVGGGSGIAPLLFWGSYLRKADFNPEFLIGARSRAYLVELEEFEKYGKVFITTEDGSKGEKGFVTDHSIFKERKFDRIYSCGPTPMMKAVGAYAIKNNTFCEVSLENTMGCGIGACLCCVTDTTAGRVCVCTEGTVFNIAKLKW